jgi:Reverse transcriptase (RNA-dependent DNA polymerase)
MFTKNSLDKIYLEEKKYWHTRDKEQWIQFGDSNTTYFHRIASNRKKKNLILNMEVEGVLSDSLPQIESHVVQFYKNLFGSAEVKKASLHQDFWDENYVLSDTDRLELEKPFTEEEIHKAVFGSEASGAPGPDGFSFLFYQHFWTLVKSDLMLLLQHFYTQSLNVSKLNHAMLCLIPKESNAQVIQKFRPISLIDYSYKIISKVLTNRLIGCVGRLVDPAQAAFIPGRYILDNVLAANEIIHFAKVHGQKGIILKVDFEKAYDRVNWSFLLEMLRSRGFGQKWTLWIENLLQGAQTCINFNGFLTSYFNCKRGLRQGTHCPHSCLIWSQIYFAKF